MAEPLASVVIPSLNGGPRFAKALEAVAAQKLDGDFEIVVIDSGSEDGSAETAGRFGRVIRIDKAEFNHGLTRNRAIAESRGKYIVLLVQDAVPAENWLAPLIQAASEEGVAGAYSRQVPRPECPPFIRARLERWSASCTEREVKGPVSESELMDMPFIERIRLLSFDNVSSCIRKEVWEKRPFRERRFGEDAVWAKEVMLDGWKIAFEPASTVEHSHDNSLWYEFKRVYLDHRNWREIAGGALFNNFIEVLQASWNGVPERWAELDKQGLAGAALWYWWAYALPWSLSQNLAQYLGSRSMKAAMRFGWYNKIDDFMSKGV